MQKRPNIDARVDGQKKPKIDDEAPSKGGAEGLITVNKDGKMEVNFKAISTSNFTTISANARTSTSAKPFIIAPPTAVAASSAVAPTSASPIPDKHNPYFDPRLGKRSYGAAERFVPSKFKFVEPGTFVSQAEQLRKAAALEALKLQIQQTAKKAGLEGQFDVVGENSISRYDIPVVEWWDSQFLPNQTYADLDSCLIESENITELVHHPIPIDLRGNVNAVRPVMLTSKEIKKTRRLRRLEENKQKQEKIRLGLLPAEQPKLKLSNFIRVLGDEAILDPTAMEAKVREQMKERADAHLNHNLSRMLTAEQKSEKHDRKHTEDISSKVHVAVFRVTNLNNPSHRFKVDKNAQQLHLTGIGILHEDRNIVVVEGGPKGIQKYKNLMLRRINWNESSATTPEKVEENRCVLLWDGLMKDASFKSFRYKECPTPEKVKQALGPTCEHFWDLVRSNV